MVKLIGILAAICTTLSLFPQAAKIHKTKKTGGISLGMYIVFTVGVALWLIYGVIIQDTPVILANAISLPFAIYILRMTAKNN